jgi:hypothetical protein
MTLLFWLCTFLLVLSSLGGVFYKGPNGGYFVSAGGILVVIDLVLLGFKVFGLPA